MSRVVDYDTMRRASPRSARLSRSRVVGPLSGFQLGKEHKLEAETSSKLSLRAAAAAGDEAAVAELDVGASTRHVGGNGDGPRLSRASYDLCFTLVLFRVEDCMLNSLLAEDTC